MHKLYTSEDNGDLRENREKLVFEDLPELIDPHEALNKILQQNMQQSGGAKRLVRRFADIHFKSTINTQKVLTPLLEELVQDTVRSSFKGTIVIEKTPESIREWKEYQQIVKAQENKRVEQEKAALQANRKASEAILGLQEVFSKLVGMDIPTIEGLAGEYISSLVVKFAKYVVEKTIEKVPGHQRSNLTPQSIKELWKSAQFRIIDAINPALAISAMVSRIQHGRIHVDNEFKRAIRNEVKNELKRETEMLRRKREIEMREMERASDAARARSRVRVRPRGR